ncbi:MAG: LicD family protein [Lachnospiraceae bacterium]|nr:LicD family protein [Lachnospiraceae bacterium]
MSKKVELSSEDLRTLQLIELEMIVEVDRICRNNGIQYSLDGGTLLGAARHKGFIPWDDDADVIFTRHEYAKFCRACKKELDRERFFLQEYRTDENYRWGYAKIRRKGTEFIRLGQEHMKYKTGVCIDVFVVDHVPDGALMRRLYYGANFFIRKVMYSELGQTAADNLLLRKMYRLLYHIPKDSMFHLRNCLAARCNRKNTELVSHLLYPYPSKETKYGMPAECFEHYRDIEFEGMQLRVFVDYDRYLTLLYHDYMELPPVEKRQGPGEASSIKLIDITLEEIQKRKAKADKERWKKRGM